MITRREFGLLVGGLMVAGLTGCAPSTSTENSSRVNSGNNINTAATTNSKNTTTSSVSQEIPTVRLNSGAYMPVVGHGTWTLMGQVAEDAVYAAILSGYRLIDTAQIYDNEQQVGTAIARAIADGLVARQELFVTSKISPANAASRPAESIDESLKTLGLEYLDLLLLHEPGVNDSGAYRAMEEAYAAGKARSIGISNFYTSQALDKVLEYATIVPAVVQNENHLLYQNTALKASAEEHGIVMESWYPLGGRDHVSELLANDTVNQLAQKYGKTPAQIIVRWQVQAGYVAIPGSGNAAHIAQNLAVFDFALSEAEMTSIAALDQQHRFENW